MDWIEYEQYGHQSSGDTSETNLTREIEVKEFKFVERNDEIFLEMEAMHQSFLSKLYSELRVPKEMIDDIHDNGFQTCAQELMLRHLAMQIRKGLIC